MIKIVVTGAESTGKTELAIGLAKHYNTLWIPELAREYIENLGRTYTYYDVEMIAREQIIAHQKIEKGEGNMIIFDTWLIVTKIWFTEVYRQVPVWLNNHIQESVINLFLVCDNDIVWEPDPVRENPDKRLYLQGLYIEEIEKTKTPWKLIRGLGEDRLKNAISAIDDYLSDNGY